MKHNTVLDEIFGGDPLPFRHVYETAQIVVRDYMAEHNCKIEVVAEQLGTTANHLYNVLDPKQTHRPLSVDRVIEITALTGDTRIIEAMKTSAKPNDGEACAIHEVMIATLDVQTHTGELSKTLNSAIADGEIDDAERARLRKVATDELGALHRVIEKLN